MIEKSIAFISNYFWRESISNINRTLQNESSSFNMNDYYYLTQIYEMGRPKLGDLAAKLSLTKPAISAMVKRLERNELVIKTQSEEDRRVYFLQLSEKGLAIIEGDYRLYERLADLLKDTFSNEQIGVLSDSLDRVVQKLSGNKINREVGVK